MHRHGEYRRIFGKYRKHLQQCALRFFKAKGFPGERKEKREKRTRFIENPLRASNGESPLVTEDTLVLAPDYKKDAIEEEGYRLLRNNAPPPALVSSHVFNMLDGGWSTGSHYFRQLSLCRSL